MVLSLSFKLALAKRGKCDPCRGLSQTSLNCGKKLESPRIPLIRPAFIKSVSPLVDPESPISLPETEVDRLRWLDRFTPRWNESSTERRRRLRKRAENMRTRRAHTEKILNSFQRLDSYTSTVLPSDLMICLSYTRFHSEATTSTPSPPSIHAKDKDGVYLTPNRILHPRWTPHKEGISTWVICHRDALQQPKKLRSIYRNLRDPKFSPNLSNQISSQLVRRVAQECVVLKDTLKRRLTPQHPTSRATPNLVPVFTSEDTLTKIISRSSGETSRSGSCSSEEKMSDLEDQISLAKIGGILVFSTRLFDRIVNSCNPEALIATASPSDPAPQNQKSLEPPQNPTLMFSLKSGSGPLPMWDIEALLTEMAKQPSKPGMALVTAALNQLTVLTASTGLVEVLKQQIYTALWEAASFPNILSSSPVIGQCACLLPLTETAYPLLLALRRATWWFGQGFEPEHLAGLHDMTDEAEARKSARNQVWEEWLAQKMSVTGQVRNNGELWINKSKPNHPEHWQRV